MNMTQHNGESGCLSCEEAGAVVSVGKGYARCYPFRACGEEAPKRTRETFLTNAIEAHESGKKVAGVMGVTSLGGMPRFDLVLGMVPDYMHGCLLGITKTLLYKWLSPTNHRAPYFIGGKVTEINRRLLQMTPPDFLVRLPRDIEKHFKNLKGTSGCGLNVHNAGAHLVDYVKGWGPLWAWSTFGFEDMNGTIMDYAHGTGNVCRQLIWMLHAQSRLRCEHEVMGDDGIRKFIGRMTNTKRELKNLKDARGCQIAGRAKALDDIPPSMMDKINEKMDGGRKKKVARVVKDGQVIFSKEYSRMVKRNACVVLFAGGEVGEIQYFVWNRDTGCTVAVYEEIAPDLDRPFFFNDAGHHVLWMVLRSNTVKAARVEDIQEKVFLLDGNEEHVCLVRVPNVSGLCG